MADTTDLAAISHEVPDDGPSRPPPPPIEWPEPTFDPQIPDQAEYPIHALPPLMADACDALYQMAGSPLPMAGTVVLTAFAAVAQADYVLYGLDPEGVPLSIYAVCAAPPAQRKSSTAKHMLVPIREGSQAAVRRWESVSRNWQAMDANGRKGSPDLAPAKMAPYMIRSDATIEALAQRLAGGRVAQMQYLSEIVKLTGGWSGREAGREKTYGDYADLWDGEPVQIIRARDGLEIDVHNRRLSTLYMGQPKPVADWVLHPGAESGYAARVLLAYQTGLSGLPPDLDRTALREAIAMLDGLRRVMTEALRQQNDGIEYASHQSPARSSITLDLEAHGLMRAFLETEQVLAETAFGDDDALMAMWHGRSVGQAQRIAGLFAALRAYQTQALGNEVVMTRDEAQNGIDLAEWYGNELKRVASMRMSTELAEDAMTIWRAIGNAIRSPMKKHIGQNADGELEGNVRQIAHQCKKALKNDPSRRNAAIQLLEIEGLIEAVPGKKSRWLIHPGAENG